MYMYMYMYVHYNCYRYIIHNVLYIERARRGISPGINNVRSIISTRPVTLSDADTYFCQGLYGTQQRFSESAQVVVRGKSVN